jgi:multicomponent K+:H+ antiporter subunit E/multicomponent Na+:H+ antiporter subunit E
MVRYAGAALLLMLIYAGALASFDPWDLFFGIVIAGGLIALFRGFLHQDMSDKPPVRPRRLLAFLPFFGAIVWEIITGTWTVARIVLHPRPQNRPGIIVVPLGERTEAGTAISALAMSLSPGSSLISIDWERRVMLVHLLDASDPDEARAALQQFYERYQRAVFP